MTGRRIAGILIATAFLIAAGIPAVSAEGATLDTVAAEKITLYNLAVDEAGAGNYTAAMEHIDASLALDANFTLAWVTKAGISSAQGDYAGALTAAETATALNPEQTEAWVVSADALVNLGRYEEAIEAADRAIALDPEMIESYIIQGTAYGQMGEYEKEIEVSEIALAIDPSDPRAQGNLRFADFYTAGSTGSTSSSPEETPFPFAGGLIGLGMLAVLSRCRQE